MRYQEWFKSLVNNTKVPVVLFGLEVSNKVLECNEQLDRRFSIRYSIPNFGYRTDEDVEDFKTLLYMLDEELPFEEPSGLTEMSDRFYYATHGSMNSITTLIREGAISALNKGKRKIDLFDLADAFDLHYSIKKDKEFNPFRKPHFVFDNKIILE